MAVACDEWIQLPLKLELLIQKIGAANDKDCNSHGSGGFHRLSHGEIPSAPGLECGRYVRLRGLGLISEVAKLTIRTMRSAEWATRDTSFGPVSTYAYLPLGSTKLAHGVMGGSS
jgi:hypothetical protein